MHRARNLEVLKILGSEELFFLKMIGWERWNLLCSNKGVRGGGRKDPSLDNLVFDVQHYIGVSHTRLVGWVLAGFCNFYPTVIIALSDMISSVTNSSERC